MASPVKPILTEEVAMFVKKVIAHERRIRRAGRVKRTAGMVPRLARELGVSIYCIRHIVYGERWRKVKMHLSREEREERRQARIEQFKIGELTEPVFRASMFALGIRMDEVDFLANMHRPPAPENYEERRMEASREWLRNRAS